ncbi:hypothetical protein B0H10DRAFT_2437938 [Mycena sp. CBHHK59/15]|nr:hypothetical protein B0H10DRAFT_2437938 [Mycena sp. CBHHK59/15]
MSRLIKCTYQALVRLAYAAFYLRLIIHAPRLVILLSTYPLFPCVSSVSYAPPLQPPRTSRAYTPRPPLHFLRACVGVLARDYEHLYISLLPSFLSLLPPPYLTQPPFNPRTALLFIPSPPVASSYCPLPPRRAHAGRLPFHPLPLPSSLLPTSISSCYHPPRGSLVIPALINSLRSCSTHPLFACAPSDALASALDIPASRIRSTCHAYAWSACVGVGRLDDRVAAVDEDEGADEYVGERCV